MSRKADRIAKLILPLMRPDGSFPLVRGITTGYVQRTGTPVDYDDVEGTAFLGLAAAASRHLARKSKFSTYATIKVSGAVMDYIRREAYMARRMPLEALDDLTGVTIESTIEADVVLRETRRIVAKTVIRTLSDFEMAVIIQSFWLGRQTSEIADYELCSTSKVNKAKKAALDKLRMALTNRGITQ